MSTGWVGAVFEPGTAYSQTLSHHEFQRILIRIRKIRENKLALGVLKEKIIMNSICRCLKVAKHPKLLILQIIIFFTKVEDFQLSQRDLDPKLRDCFEKGIIIQNCKF